MLHIAICDDEIKIGAELECALINTLAELKVKAETEVFFSGEALCRQMEGGSHYDLIFLDIEFAKNEIDGVEVGRLVRDAHQNNSVSIVYISWQQKYAMDLFAIRPMDFIVKPITHERIERTVRAYLNITGLRAGEFTYKIGHDAFKVKIKDIAYFENRNRKIVIHLADGTSNAFYGSLKEIYNERLDGYDFLFIHASYVVNFDHITNINYNQLTLAGGITPFPISQQKRNEVRERYYEILRKRGM